ncbi:Timeless domain containing protein [Elaphomyces granulatus]
MDVEAALLGQNVQVVDPEVRAYVYILVTALGGFNGEDAGRYVLGDDALACLRDIKKWLKLHDEKSNRMDVARCLGEANLVNGDLLPILSLWWESGQNSKHMSRISLACLEILVPLTWPVEVHSQMTVNHHRHTPYLQQAQVLYKRGILSKNMLGILRAVIKIGLPSMAIPRSERTARDEGILKLMLYLFRNIAIISPSTRLAVEGDEEETSRSATINAFHEQDVFALLLTMCSNIGDDFNLVDIIILEILFHLVKGVDVEKLFIDDGQCNVKRVDELGSLLQKESGLKREYAKNAPTRHGRFGTMVWVKRDDQKVSTVSGQDILKDDHWQATLLKMDQSKKWSKPQPQRRQDVESSNNDFNLPTHLTSPAAKNLRTFVEELLDSGFNPLFIHVRKAIEREADRVVDANSRQFFYLVAWFLEAERSRRSRQKQQRDRNPRASKEIEPDSFALVAGVLNQETFIFLNRAMQYSFDNKDWQDLNAIMRCFTQILLTIQEMAQSPLEEDREIAENIQNRIFYEETTHDRVLSILRGYKDQGFGYLDACTELSHVFLRMLERYSKQNLDMQVRSRRRSKRQKLAERSTDDNENDNEDHDSEAEELLEVARVTKERKFDFNRFSARFCNQKSVDTFVAFASFYRELSEEQLKRAHRFFYRVAFKQEMSVLLFRMDIIYLFHGMIKGPSALHSSKSIFNDWEEFVRQLIRRLIKKIEQRPALVMELLFSKINSTLFYLEYGYEKQTTSTDRKPPPELEVKPSAATTKSDKLGIVVAALVKDGRGELVRWVCDVLGSAADERSSWQKSRENQQTESPDAPPAPCPGIDVKPRDESHRTAMFKNARLRLLMSLVGFEKVGEEDVPEASWIVPSLAEADLRDTKSIIEKALEKPPSEDDGIDPRKQLRRKRVASSSVDHYSSDIDFGSDSEGEDNIPDGLLFPPNPRSKSNTLDELKKNRRKRRQKDDDDESLDDAQLEEHRRNRQANALARQAKIKSDLYIHASDDDTDEDADRDFFLQEEERRKTQAERIRQELLASVPDDASKNTQSKKRRKRRNAGDDLEGLEMGGKKRRQMNALGLSDDDSEDDILMMDIASSKSQDQTSASHKNPGHGTLTSDDDLDVDDNLAFHKSRDYENLAPIDNNGEVGHASHKAAAAVGSDDDDAPVMSSRRRMKGGFVVDSDSE